MADKKEPVSPEQLSEICLSCGMCCDGTLYSHIPLQSSEKTAANARGWSVGEVDDGQAAFISPCPALSGALCTIYGDRPKICGAYSCRVLNRVKNHKLSVPEAQNIIAEACDLRDQLREYLEPGITLFTFREQAVAAQNDWQSLPKEERKRRAPAMHLITRLSTLLNEEVAPPLSKTKRLMQSG